MKTRTASGASCPNLTEAWWEACYPVPEDRDAARDRRRRYDRTVLKFRLANWIGPEQKYAHVLRADNHEECFFMLANSAVSVQQIMGFQGYQYARELFKENLTEPYLDLRLQYQILASQRSGRQWVMKCPLHLWFLDNLLTAFPDARIIHTHRAAAEAVPSVASLSAIMGNPFTEDFRPDRHGAFFKEFCRAGIDRAMEVRSRIPPSRIFDVRLIDLERDPIKTLRGIYGHFDLPWDEETMAGRIATYVHTEAEKSRRRRRNHTYSAEEFGLSVDELSSEFADYESLFLDE